MDIKNARRRSFDVTYVVVTEDNIEEVAAWCNGEIGTEGTERYVKINDKNAISTRQAKAFPGGYILKMSETGTSFKAFTEKAFHKSFEPIAEVKVSRSAKTGKFVSHEEAVANPDTTVTEEVVLKGVGEIVEPRGEQPYWEVHNDETIYFSPSGEEITKAEYDAWGKN